MELDFERCYRAVDSRDQRFDGWFFTAVTSTGIYCRPSCPAITPKRQNVRFYPSAAAAQRAGLPGLPRCRPDAAPGSPDWDVRADVGRPGDAADRRRGGRPRRRAGAGRPARLHRAAPAPDAHRRARRRPARAGPGPAGPDRPDPDRDDRPRPRGDRVRGRIRQRAAVQRHDPGGVRRRALGPARRRSAAAARPKPGAITLRLPYRPPLHADALLDFLAARAIAGRRGGRRRHVPPGAAPAARHGHGGADPAARPRASGDAAARPTSATWRRRWPAAAGCSTSTPTRRPSTPRWPPTRRWPRRSRRAGGTGAARGRRLRDRGTGDRRPADLGRRRPHGARPAGRGKLAPGRRSAGRSRTRSGGRRCPDAAFGMPAARRRDRSRGAGPGGRSTARVDLDPAPTARSRAARCSRCPASAPGPPATSRCAPLGDPDVFLPTDLAVRRGAAALGLPDDPGRWTRTPTLAPLALVRH